MPAPKNNEGLSNTAIQENNSLARKNSASYGYLCPECHRIYSASVYVSVNMELRQQSGISFEQTLTAPKVNIVSSDALTVTCQCGHEMVPMNKYLASIVREFKLYFGFTDIVVSHPIARTGESYNIEELDFCDDISTPHMQRLIGVLESFRSALNFGFDGVKTLLSNDTLGRCAEIEKCTADYESLLKIKDKNTHVIVKGVGENSNITVFLGKILSEFRKQESR